VLGLEDLRGAVPLGTIRDPEWGVVDPPEALGQGILWAVVVFRWVPLYGSGDATELTT
jgi:hypothetical protein